MRLTTAAAAKRSAELETAKVYRLHKAIPTEMKPSAGRTILESIRRHRKATVNMIRKDMKRGFSDATLRFYLGAFQRRKMIVAA